MRAEGCGGELVWASFPSQEQWAPLWAWEAVEGIWGWERIEERHGKRRVCSKKEQMKRGESNTVWSAQLLASLGRPHIWRKDGHLLVLTFS